MPIVDVSYLEGGGWEERPPRSKKERLSFIGPQCQAWAIQTESRLEHKVVKKCTWYQACLCQI